MGKQTIATHLGVLARSLAPVRVCLLACAVTLLREEERERRRHVRMQSGNHAKLARLGPFLFHVSRNPISQTGKPKRPKGRGSTLLWKIQAAVASFRCRIASASLSSGCPRRLTLFLAYSLRYGRGFTNLMPTTSNTPVLTSWPKPSCFAPSPWV